MRQGYLLILTVVLLLIVAPVKAQDTPVVTIDFREIRFTPEDVSVLSSNFEVFRTDSRLVDMLTDNNTLFWESIGGYDSNFWVDDDISSYALVSVNETGFYQSIVALNPDNGDLEWIRELRSSYSSNFTHAVRTATDFFADDGHYWGLCEELILIPGAIVGLPDDAVWRFKFYLVGETERWTLLVDTNGDMISYQFEDIPCQSCNDYTPYVIAGIASVIVLVFASIYILKIRRH